MSVVIACCRCYMLLRFSLHCLVVVCWCLLLVVSAVASGCCLQRVAVISPVFVTMFSFCFGVIICNCECVLDLVLLMPQAVKTCSLGECLVYLGVLGLVFYVIACCDER